MKFEGSKVLVTGANRGIGRAFVEQLRARNAGRIYAGMRRRSAWEPTDERVVPVSLDVTQPGDIEAAARAVGGLDLLINNAGTLKSYSVLEATKEQLDHDLAVNFFGVLNVTRAFIPMLEASKGAVLNVLSLVSMASMAGIGGYSASKAAAWSMTQALRVELGKKSIGVFAVYPGAVDTDMLRGFDVDKASPEEIATNALAALERGEHDSFPDAMSRQAGEAWLNEPRSLERMFAAL